MWDTIQKLEYRAATKIPDAQKECLWILPAESFADSG